MSLLNYTTNIAPDKTCSEIGKILSSHGVMKLMTDYDEESGLVSAISFQIRLSDGRLAGFRLPCDWRPVLTILMNDPKVPRPRKTQEQAVKTSWRIVKDWCEAQMALVETNMVKTEEVFMPYMVMKDGQTLAQKMQTNPQFLLGSGE